MNTLLTEHPLYALMSHAGENTDHGIAGYFRITKTLHPKSHPMRMCQRYSDYTKSIRQKVSRQQKQKWFLLLKSKSQHF